MSHQPERKDKDCLNCGTIVHGRYCHVCGQENIIPKQNFWALAKHFIYDIFHFDGKFFETVKYLFTRPGYTAKEYINGKRKHFLDPIRMYLFTSAVFFLMFFSLGKTPGLTVNFDERKPFTDEERKEKISDYTERIKESPEDSAKLTRRILILNDTTRPVSYYDLYRDDTTIIINGTRYRSLQHYDSLQTALPEKEKHSWLMRLIARKTIEINKRHHGNSVEMISSLWQNFIHRMPYLLFLSLPFFALTLKLLYIRRKEFFYSDHAVFTLYHYIFSFILLLVVFGINALNDWLGGKFWNILSVVLIILWPVYLWIEMRRFYGQGKRKTFGKFLLLNLIGFIILLLLSLIMFLFSLYQM